MIKGSRKTVYHKLKQKIRHLKSLNDQFESVLDLSVRRRFHFWKWEVRPNELLALKCELFDICYFLRCDVRQVACGSDDICGSMWFELHSAYLLRAFRIYTLRMYTRTHPRTCECTPTLMAHTKAHVHIRVTGICMLISGVAGHLALFMCWSVQYRWVSKFPTPSYLNCSPSPHKRHITPHTSFTHRMSHHILYAFPSTPNVTHLSTQYAPNRKCRSLPETYTQGAQCVCISGAYVCIHAACVYGAHACSCVHKYMCHGVRLVHKC